MVDLEVLLLPGMDGTGDLYLGLQNSFSEDIVASVLRYPPDVVVADWQPARMVESLAPERPFVLVAESYSTPIAIRFAATKPEFLKGLVLCAGFARSPVQGWRKVTAKLAGHIIFDLPISDSVLDRFLLGPDPPDSLRAEVRKALAQVKPRVLESRLASILRCDVRQELKEVTVPILYLQATEDRLVEVECLEEILRENPRVEVVKIAGPHLLFQRESQRSAEIIERFVRALL
jgi:pimeloyl-[acyl-carrier protein] methyl ester esterase